MNYGPQSALSIVHFRKENFAEALEAAQRTIHISAAFQVGHIMRIASYMRLGRLDDARGAVRRLLDIHPRYRVEAVRNVRYGGSSTNSIVAALLEAGLPE